MPLITVLLFVFADVYNFPLSFSVIHSMLLLGLLQRFPSLANCNVIKFTFSILQDLAQDWRQDKGDSFDTQSLTQEVHFNK